MARRVVIVVRERRKRVWPKWRRAGVGVVLSIATLVLNALGILPFGVFGFIFTAVAATTFITVMDASFTSLAGGADLFVDQPEPDDDDPYDLDELDKAR